ncbi:MAG: hypothetical protein K6G83_06165 [Lachnospiraceae bacterium]|nr:hypothetical protein [Lachnospiraceae bacterium]
MIMGIIMLVITFWVIKAAFRFSWGLLKLVAGLLLFLAFPAAVMILMTIGITALLLIPFGMFSVGLPLFRRGSVI